METAKGSARRLRPRAQSRTLLSAAMLSLAGALAAGPAWALPSCLASPSTISKCCAADQPGKHYALGADLTRSASGDCIDISAPNVLLSMNGHHITFTGSVPTGVGVHVLSTAPNAIFFGDSPIQGFLVGFQTDAANTISYSPFGYLGRRGVVFNGANGVSLLPIAYGSVSNGIVLTPAASGSYFYEPESVSNSGNGIVLNGATGVTLHIPYSVLNTGYGLWLKASSFNSVVDGVLEGNTIAGLYAGCHPKGPSTTACSIPASNFNNIDGAGGNELVVGSCVNNAQNNQQFGVVIDAGNSHNRVFGVQTDTNSNCGTPGDITDDGFDGNIGLGCLGNFWFSNNFSKKNHPPSGAHPFCMQ